jgi:DNA repair protein RecN (Recombination protein N)
MLNQLRISDFAIIDHLELDFGTGLVILTGETGAGKSILMDAIQALIGGAVDPTMIRSGANKARLEASIHFSADQPDLEQVLLREELLEDPGHLVLEREIRLEGRSTARINGHVVNQAIMREVGSFLVDIHGQSEHLSLLNTHSHLGLLDRYARDEEALSRYQKTYQHLNTVRKELRELVRMEKENQSRLELIQFQLDEIQSARLVSGEDLELEKERTRLANAENLAALGQEALTILDEPSPDVPSVTDLLGQVNHQLNSLIRVDQSQQELAEAANSLLENAQELARNIRNYSEQIEFNPHRLEEVEERLELIHHLTRKYGGSIESVIAYAQNNHQLLEKISNTGARIAELQQSERETIHQLAGLAAELSNSRHAAAEKIGRAVENELNELRMEGARFMVGFSDRPNQTASNESTLVFDSQGIDEVEFLIAPNPGEGFKPLVKIASGGETSRLMLALKNVLAKEDQIPTLIFDEIDQGIGGRVGMVVGKKLWQLARYHQVFCVTHLPQLAAYGEQHFRVEKQIRDNRTITHVTRLDGDSRIEELAQMLGTDGSSIKQSASELLSAVQQDCKKESKLN